MADGKVVIETKLDNSGVEKGIKSLKEMLVKGVKGTITAIGLNTLKNAIKSITIETNTLMDSVRKASTLFGDVNVNTGLLAESMARLASSTGVSSDEIGEALYNALSAGVEATEDMGVALEFVEKAIKTSKAGFASLGDTVTATASVLNAYGLATSEADRVQGVLIQTQNLGITTVAELASTLAQVVPTASAYAVSFEQVGSALATMTAQGTKTAQATTSLNALLAELGKNGQTASDNLKKASNSAGLGEKSFSDLVNEGYDLADILLLMKDYAEKNDLTLVDMFGSIEAGKASLQIVSQEGEKFKNSLASMEDTAGLVEQSFSKVATNAERLKSSFKELQRLIGLEFAPAVTNAMGNLADFAEKLVYANRESGLLEGHINDLSLAIKDYKDIQEETKGATDDLTLALQAQSQAMLVSTLFESATTYKKAKESIIELENENVKLQEKADSAFDTVIQKGKEANVTLEQIREAYATGDKRFASLTFEYALALDEANGATQQILENNTVIEQSKREISDFVSAMLELYRQGSIDIELFRYANEDLYKTIKKSDTYYEQAKASLEQYNYSLEQMQNNYQNYLSYMNNYEVGSDDWLIWASYAYAYADAIAEVEKSQRKLNATNDAGSDSDGEKQKNLEAISEAYAEIDKKMQDAEATAKALGDSYDLVDEKISIATSGIKKLISLGVDPMDEEIQKLVKSLSEWSEEQAEVNALVSSFRYDPPIDETDEVWDAYQNLNSELLKADEMYKILGDEYDIVGAKTSAYQSALERLSSAGIDMNRASVQRLIEEYENLLSETDKLAKKQEIANKVSNVLSTSFKAFADSIANTEKRLKELDKELADVNDDIADGEKEKLELLEEIADAQARNDEEDEERARKRLEALEKEIKGHEELKETLETEAKEVKSGQTAWKALGKSALEALAQILQGLGDELTARAVLATLTGNFAGAISAGIGASGAYIASSAIKSKANSFEQGGIVQQQRGVSPTGDNHIVFANAGELILNQAQQANLADQIRAMSESLGARNAVIVNMSGSYIYGLNEPAVGRAIYDNIETLRAEGVL